jgi:putative oxidoreductase
MRNWYEGLIAAGEHLQSTLLLAIRLFWGYQFFLSGWGKLHNIADVADFFRDLGIPLAGANAYVASSIECFGGLLLIFGLGTRLIAIPLAFTMVIAYLTAHWEATSHLFSDPIMFLKEPPFTFLLITIILFAFGPGNFSLDYLLERFVFKRNRTLNSPQNRLDR